MGGHAVVGEAVAGEDLDLLVRGGEGVLEEVGKLLVEFLAGADAGEVDLDGPFETKEALDGGLRRESLRGFAPVVAVSEQCALDSANQGGSVISSSL